MVKNGCGQSGDGTLKLTYLKNEQMEQSDFLHAHTDAQKLKIDQNFFVWTWSKMGVASLVTGP